MKADSKRQAAEAMQIARLVVAGYGAVMSKDGQKGWRDEWRAAAKIVEE